MVVVLGIIMMIVRGYTNKNPNDEDSPAYHFAEAKCLRLVSSSTNIDKTFKKPYMLGCQDVLTKYMRKLNELNEEEEIDDFIKDLLP